jgi:hypothetical protein
MTSEQLDGDRIFVIHDFLTAGECAALIQRSEGLVYEVGTVGETINEQVRNNDRVLVDRDMKDACFRLPYLSIRPKEGMALVFIHRIWHKGAVVESGQKLVLRTDVMFGPLPKQ